MTDGDALLKAIIDDPHDDLPRLAYADWLEEHGGEVERARAEFIRVQHKIAAEPAKCGYSRLDTCFDRRENLALVISTGCHACAARGRLIDSEDEAVRFNAYRWIDDALPEELRDGFGTWTREGPKVISKRSACRYLLFRRGFIEEISLSLNAAREHLPRLVREHPLTRVEIADFRFGRVGDCSGLQKWPARIYVHNTEKVEQNAFATYLPKFMKPFLKGGRVVVEAYGDREYMTDEEGLNDLSEAWLAWARSKK